jgi:enterochelin esterase-like enzyme
LRQLIACLVLGVTVVAGCRGHESPAGHPASRDAAGPLEAAVAEVEAGRRQTPLIGQPGRDGAVPVTFLARAEGGVAPRVVSDVTGWGEHVDGTFDFQAGRMSRVGGSAWYALEPTVVSGARIEYMLAYGIGDSRPDPHNPRHSVGPERGGAPASEFVTPGYLPPPEFADPSGLPRGATAETVLQSRLLSGTCRFVVYTPPGYRPGGDYPVAVVLTTRSAILSRVLDWQIAHRAIEPVVAVFVSPEFTGDDSRGGAWSPAFITRELLPWLARRFAVTRDSRRRAIFGVSFGARDALDSALESNEAFGRLGLLVPGRRISPADLAGIAARSRGTLRVAILAGRYDQANVPTARGLGQALSAAGHVVDYIEVAEGHSAVTWTNHFGRVLVSLFGGGEGLSVPAAQGPAQFVGERPESARR